MAPAEGNSAVQSDGAEGPSFCRLSEEVGLMALDRAPAVSTEALSIFRLPSEVLRHALTFVEEPAALDALSLTCKSMQAAAADPLLKASWLLKHRPEGAMFLAARKRCSDVVLHMLKSLGVSAVADVDVGGVLPLPQNPLGLAVVYKLPEVVEYLLARDDVRASWPVWKFADTLYWTAKMGFLDCMQVLLTPPSPVNANSSGSRGRRPLHSVYAFQPKPEACEVLLSHGAAVTVCDEEGSSPLHSACLSSHPFTTTIVRMLLNAHGGEGMSMIDSQDSKGMTPLHHAAYNRNLECCEELLRAGCQVNVRTNEGFTPYKMAEGWLSLRYPNCEVKSPELSSPEFFQVRALLQQSGGTE